MKLTIDLTPEETRALSERAANERRSLPGEAETILARALQDASQTTAAPRHWRPSERSQS